MAAPALVVVAKQAAKKIIFDVLTEPEKILKYIFGLLGVVAGLLLLLVVPIMLLVSIPFLLFSSPSQSASDTQKQMETIAIYQNIPVDVNNQTMQWVNNKKSEVNVSDITTDIYFNLNWQSLMAIDSVRYEQDYNKTSKSEITSLAQRFIIKDVQKGTYTTQETYTVTVANKSGGSHSETRTRVVTKERAIIKVRTKTLSEVCKELNFSDDQLNMAQNIYNTLLVEDIEDSQNKFDIDISDLKEYPPGNANIPYFNQADKRWATSSYGKTGTIKSSGCGPTSLAMVIFGLTGRTDVNPKVIADWSYSNGHRCEGAGSYWSLMTEGGKNFGLKVETISRKNPKGVVEELSKGNPIVVSMGPGHFTKGGHFIVLRGLTSDGKVLVNDPASIKRTEESWDLSIIMSESSTLGGESGSPFWVFTK